MTDGLPLVDIEKCWELGAAFLGLRGLYIEGDFSDPEKKRHLRRALHTIRSICKAMDIQTEEVQDLLECIQKSVDPPSVTIVLKEILLEALVRQQMRLSQEDFDGRLETALDGALMGKNPHYTRIFGAALHTLSLHVAFREEEREKRKGKQSRFRDFVYEFDPLRSVLPPDEYALVWSVLEDWDKRWNKWQENDEKQPEEDELKYIAHKIGGLIKGSLKVPDVLERQDRIQWAFVSGGILLLLGGGVLLILLSLLHLLTPWLFTYVSLPLEEVGTAKDLLDMLNKALAFLGTIGVGVMGLGQAAKKLWKEIGERYVLHLARRRLLNPKARWLV